MRKNLRRTGKEKAIVAITLAMLLGMTGCAGKEPEPEKIQENVLEEEGAQEEAENGSGADDSVTQKESEEKSANSEEPENGREEDSVDSVTEKSSESDEDSHTVTVSPGTEHLGGKVLNPQADGMTFAQTTLVDEDGMVTLLDVEDAKKIPVKFTEDTKVEHWTIQGGGAGIDMQSAAVSDLEDGMGVELEGYFEGETFVATKVIIEDYV